jgi:hypothetical protein
MRRAARTKQFKGRTLVLRPVLWQTHKELPLLAGAKSDWPPYVIIRSDYSRDRAESLQRDIRVSNSHMQIEQLWDDQVKEKIVKGWMLNSTSVAA